MPLSGSGAWTVALVLVVAVEKPDDWANRRGVETRQKASRRMRRK
jgi:hypothetical protein